MARRGGRPGDYLMVDDYYGFTKFASQLREDYWGNYAEKPLLRNLQEISFPLNDPQPVPIFRGANYEFTPVCVGETAPKYVGNTLIPTARDNAAVQALNLFPSIGTMEVGCTLKVA